VSVELNITSVDSETEIIIEDIRHKMNIKAELIERVAIIQDCIGTFKKKV
jgi:hypothetical protein